VFSFLPGITSDQSQQIVAANPALFTAIASSSPQVLTLSASFAPTTTLTIPDGIALDPADANATLAKYATDATAASALAMIYHPINIITSALAELLSVDVELLAEFLTMTGVDLGSAEIFAALQTPFAVTAPASSPPRPPAVLIDLVSKLVPLKVLFGGGAYTPDDLAFLQKHAALFMISDFNKLTIANVRKLSVYQSFAANLMNAGQTDMSPLRDVLTSYSTATHFNPKNLRQTCNRSQHRQTLASIHHAQCRFARDAARGARHPRGARVHRHEPRRRLGSAETDHLRKICGPTLAVNAVFGAFRAQFRSTQDFADRVQPFDDKLRARKRDGLTDYLLRCGDIQFKTLDDLYKYFLLDVHLEGIMQTSWVVAAISSAQLYVYRCIMNLEQDDRETSDPDHIEVKLGAEPLLEWEWRQNYRLWQANREVFLYPDNYILPEFARRQDVPLRGFGIDPSSAAHQ
jgi:hypothetical protein